MNGLFAGMLLVLLDLKIEIFGFALDALPDFAGYYLIFEMLAPLVSESPRLGRARMLSLGMAVFSGALWFMEAGAEDIHAQFLCFCLGIPALAGCLLLGHWTVTGIAELEQRRGWILEAEKLCSMWRYTALILAIAYFTGWVPLVGTVGSVAALVMSVCFLAAFFRTRGLYEKRTIIHKKIPE